MEDLRRRTGRSGLEIILVNLWEGVDARTEARRFAELWGVGGPVLMDETGEFASRLGIRGVPTNVLVDSDGTVLAVGASTPHDLEAAVRGLLGPGAAVDAPDGERDQRDNSHIQRNVAGEPGSGQDGQGDRR